MGENSMLNELVPLLKNYLELSDKDRESQLEIIRELKSAVKEARECSINMKLQIKQLETHSEMFTKSCADRKADCFHKFQEIEIKMKDIPSSDAVDLRDKEITELGNKMDSLSDKVDKLVLRVYVLIGSGAGVFSFIRWAWPLIKKGTE